MTAQLVVSVEGFHRVIAIGVGRVQLAEGMKQQFVDVGLLLGQDRQHLEPHGALVVVGAQQLLELGGAHRRAEKGLVLLGQFLELQGQSRLLDVERGAIGRELMARQQQIQQPVIRLWWLGAGEVEEEALVKGCPADLHLHRELVALHAQLFGLSRLVVVELRSPLTIGVVPEHDTLACQRGVETLVDTAGGGGGGRHQRSWRSRSWR